jgi:hypothetical protein
MSTKQTDIFNQLSATFSPETVKKWEAMVTAWNANPKKPNPYQEPMSGGRQLFIYIDPLTDILPGTTLQDVRLELTRECAVQASVGNLPRHKVSAVAFLMMGFELEDSQYV